MIPKIIIQTWKTVDLPIKSVSLVNKLQELHTEYDYKFFTDADIIDFFEKNYPHFLNTFNSFEENIQKFDFFRYVAVYHYGGFYFDLDMDFKQNLDDLCQYDCVFPIEISKLPETHLKAGFQIGQYAFGASKGNDFLWSIITNIVDKKNRELKMHRQLKVYFTTGPCLVTQLYYEYENKSTIHLINDKMKRRNFFGHYAEHKLFGSWK